MWVVYGTAAAASAMIGLLRTAKSKSASGFCFASLALTAMTLCAFCGMTASWVAAEDWTALTDVMPAMSKILWICTIISIAMNGVSLLKKRGE